MPLYELLCISTHFPEYVRDSNSWEPVLTRSMFSDTSKIWSPLVQHMSWTAVAWFARCTIGGFDHCRRKCVDISSGIGAESSCHSYPCPHHLKFSRAL